jgi:hypothetical protein
MPFSAIGAIWVLLPARQLWKWHVEVKKQLNAPLA